MGRLWRGWMDCPNSWYSLALAVNAEGRWSAHWWACEKSTMEKAAWSSCAFIQMGDWESSMVMMECAPTWAPITRSQPKLSALLRALTPTLGLSFASTRRQYGFLITGRWLWLGTSPWAKTITVLGQKQQLMRINNCRWWMCRGRCTGEISGSCLQKCIWTSAALSLHLTKHNNLSKPSSWNSNNPCPSLLPSPNPTNHPPFLPSTCTCNNSDTNPSGMISSPTSVKITPSCSTSSN